jgi:hypothetical protein
MTRSRFAKAAYAAWLLKQTETANQKAGALMGVTKDYSEMSIHDLNAEIQRLAAENRRLAQVPLRDIFDTLCICGHAQHQHTYVSSGAFRCKSFGCGCSDFEIEKAVR